MSVQCPSCGEQLEVRREDAGRKGQCLACGRVFRLGEAPQAAAPAPAEAAMPTVPASPPPAEKPRQSELVTFSCSLCDTRITARAADVGKRIACPDCGRKNVIPPPPPPKAPVIPAAMEGDQFELWGVDESPTAERSSVASKLHPVECKLCQTLMYATDAQIGTKLKCPDCGTLTEAKRTAPRRPKGSALVADGEEYQIDAALAPPPRPAPVPIAVRDAELHESTRATTVGPDGRLIVQKKPDQGRPVRPAMPLIQGVWRMLFTEEIIARGLLISLLFGASAWCLIDSINTPVQSVAAIMGIFLMLLAVAFGVLWTSFAAPLFLAVVSESSEGHDRLHEPPEWSPFDWLGAGMYLLAACGASAWPSVLAWQFGGALPLTARIAAGAGAALLLFPLAMLGALLESSPFGVISPRLFSTLGRCSGQWLLFYVLSAALAAAAGAVATGLMYSTSWGLFVLPVIAMAFALAYMRLLGRLAWWIGDAMPAPPEPEREYSRYRTEIAPRQAPALDAPATKSTAPRS
jgi:DNA-directed RNA polymerase subunit M/transcription elongation factor TFIIS